MENNEKNKTLLIVIIAVVVLFACLMVSCCAAVFYAVSQVNRDSFTELIRDTSAEEKPESAVLPTAAQDEQDPEDSSLEENGLTKAELQIIEETEAIRGIKADKKLVPIYQTEEELRQNMIDEIIQTDDEDIANDLELYSILGFAPDNFDLRQVYVDLYSEQTAGFFDPKENQMYLIDQDSDAENALTLAHEYTHYLQYNYPDFDKTLHYDDDYCETNGETCLVIDALIEGDASLTENLIDLAKILGNTDTGNSSDSSVYESLPKFFQDSLIFSYLYGFDFVAYHYLKGGFDAVNDLYINLPESIEQIMHPDKYLQDHPVEVSLEPFRSIIDKSCEIKREDVMNESDVLMVLASAYDENWQLSERQAKTAAEGWGGGSFIHASADGKPLFFSKLVWDTVSDSEEAADAFSIYLNKRFGDPVSDNHWQGEQKENVYLIRQDDILYWMILPESFDSGSLVSLIENGSTL